MTPRTRRIIVDGAAGPIEVALDEPPAERVVRGTALIAHPHPLFGGTMDNKVVQTLARAANQCGWRALRFNFRGVGGSGGVHDHGNGETQDMLHVLDTLAPQGYWVLGGFSFGAFVGSRVLTEQARRCRLPTSIVWVGTAVARFAVEPVPAECAERVLLVHGESDDTVPLAGVMDWARPQGLPVTVFPGGGHFFHGQLPQLRNLVARHLV